MKRSLVVGASEFNTKLANEALGEMFAIEFAEDFVKGSELATESYFDVIVACVNESNFEDAMKVFSHLRQFDHYLHSPFIIIADTKNSAQLGRAFEIGCDEYLAQPVEPIELKVRVRARLRDSFPMPKQNYYWAADLRFCAGTLRVVATDDLATEDLELTPNEFRILFLLSRHQNKTLSRETILTEVWGQNMHVVERTVDKHVCSLRRKLGKRSAYLVSVPNKGYMFHVPQKQKQGPAAAVASSAVIQPAS